MGAPSFQLEITSAALADLDEIDDYWYRVGDPERGEQYVRDLRATSIRELTAPDRAVLGRPIKCAVLPNTLEIRVFKGSYRIIYRVDADLGIVYVLRFWHSHRDEPDTDDL